MSYAVTAVLHIINYLNIGKNLGYNYNIYNFRKLVEKTIYKGLLKATFTHLGSFQVND